MTVQSLTHGSLDENTAVDVHIIPVNNRHPTAVCHAREELEATSRSGAPRFIVTFCQTG